MNRADEIPESQSPSISTMHHIGQQPADVSPTAISQPVSASARLVEKERSGGARHPRWLAVAVSFALALVTALLFARTATFDFVDYDDFLYVVQNEIVQQGLTLDNVRWAFVTPVAGNWHPLTMLSHMLDCQLYGLDAGGHHATNVLLHTANTVLLFLVLWRMTSRLWPSALVAALFAWHPLHVESVAWVAERKDVLSTLFWFLTLAAYLSYARRPSIRRYALVALLFTAGLMSKPMLVTVPALLLLLDFWPLRRFRGFQREVPPVVTNANTGETLREGMPPIPPAVSWQRLVVEKIPLFGISLVFSGLTLLVQRMAGAVQPFESNPLVRRVANAMISYVEYVVQAIWPLRLAVFYPHPMSALNWTLAAVCTVLLLATTAIAVVGWKRRPFHITGWFWYLGTLVPVIGIIQAGGQARADRYTYVPLVGLFIAVAWTLDHWARGSHRRQWIAAAASLAVLGTMLPVTYRQIGYWRDTVTLFEHALAVTQDNYVAHFGVGNGLMLEHDRREEATGQCDPDLLNRAIEQYAQAVRLRPAYDSAHYGMAGALKKLERYEEAVEHFNACVELGFGDENLYTHLGECYEKLNQPDAARRQYEKALQISADAFAARHRLIDLLLRQGEVAEALRVCRSGLDHQPNDPRVADRLARILATARQPRYRDGRQAVRWAEKACQLTQSKNPQLLDTLSAAYAEAGRFDEAIAAARRALERIRFYRSRCNDAAKLEKLDELAREISRHIDRYRRRQPVRETPLQWAREPMVTS